MCPKACSSLTSGIGRIRRIGDSEVVGYDNRLCMEEGEEEGEGGACEEGGECRTEERPYLGEGGDREWTGTTWLCSREVAATAGVVGLACCV